EKVVDHLELGAGALLDAGGDRSDFRIIRAFQHEDAIPTENRIQWRAQLVRKYGQELILAAIRGLRFGAQLPLPLQGAGVLGSFTRRCFLVACDVPGDEDQRTPVGSVIARAAMQGEPLRCGVQRLYLHEQLEISAIAERSSQRVTERRASF